MTGSIRSSWVTLPVDALHNAEPHAKGPVMSRGRLIGLEVDAETTAVAVAEPTGEVRSLGVIPNWYDSIRRVMKKLGPTERLRACYEACPTGYVVCWQLTALGVRVWWSRRGSSRCGCRTPATRPCAT